MFYDLNVPYEPSDSRKTSKGAKKREAGVAGELQEHTGLDAQLDILVHLGYSVIALNQTITGPFNPKQHQNTLQGLRARDGVIILRRLTIILNEDSEKGSGLIASSAEALKSYDLIAICPMTASTFQHACLTYSVASATTAHIICLDLQANQRLPFFLKPSLVRTAIKNGAVFEIRYCTLMKRGNGERARRNWWINAKEVVRASGGKGLIFTGGGSESQVRGPKDVINLAILLGCKQDQAQHAMSTTVTSLLLRAQTRQTYRAVLSEPRLVMPPQASAVANLPPPPPKRPLDDESDHSIMNMPVQKRKKDKKNKHRSNQVSNQDT